MSKRAFDRYMVDVEIGGNAKIGRLTDAQFRCMVAGVWPLAAKASIRGCLLVADQPATAEDVARQARCSVGVARRTMERARELNLIVSCPELGCEMVHDWTELNPSPRVDRTAAERQKRRRDRIKQQSGAGSVTPMSRRDNRDCHAPEEEVEEKNSSLYTAQRGKASPSVGLRVA